MGTRKLGFSSYIVLLLVAAALGLSCAATTQGEAQASAFLPQLTPTSKQRQLDKTIANLLSQHHYQRGKLDDAHSSAILDAYLEALDFNRVFFLASDIASFEKYRYYLDNHLRAGNLQPAFDMFNVYLRRLQERTELIQRQLKGSIDFTIDEAVDLDRQNAGWARSPSELDEIWRKRLKNEPHPGSGWPNPGRGQENPGPPL